MRLRCLVLLGSSLLLSFSLFAQKHTESVTVEVVDVPVYVARGDVPLGGLTAENFELYVNGKRQPIEYFEELTAEQDGSELRQRRLFLLLFDLTFSQPFSLVRAQRAAAKLIADAGPEDFFAVATYTSRRGVWIAVPFTRERESLARAIGSLTSPESGDPLALVMTASERASFADWSPQDGERSLGDPGELRSRIAADALRDLQDMGVNRAAKDQIVGLDDLAQRLASIDGQKHVVLLSEGFYGRSPSPFRIDQLTSPTRMDPNGVPTFRYLAAQSMIVPSFIHRQLERMYRSYQESDVFLHAMDLEGVGYTWMFEDGLNLLASGTGGRYEYGRNDLGEALRDLSASLSRGYRLGFRPDAARRGHNSIRVKVTGAGRGLRVQYRRGFSGTPEAVDIDDGFYLADVLQNDVPQTGTAAALEHHDGTLRARIPMQEVAAQLEGAGHAELLVYAFSEEGRALGYKRELIPVAVDATGEHTIEITLPPGARTAKALLRVDGSLGFSKIAL